MKECISGAFQSAWSALDIDSAIFAIRCATECGQIIEVKVDIVGHHQVHVAIPIVVAKRRSGRPPSIPNSGFGSYICEGAISIIVIENVAAEAGYVKVRRSIVVVVSYSPAHGQASFRQPCLFSYIGKCSIMIVMVKSPKARFSRARHIDGWSVGKINVRPAIAVIVEDDNAAAHRFEDVALVCGRGVRKSNACFGSDIFQLWNWAISTLSRLSASRWRRRRGMTRFLRMKLAGCEVSDQHQVSKSQRCASLHGRILPNDVGDSENERMIQSRWNQIAINTAPDPFPHRQNDLI